MARKGGGGDIANSQLSSLIDSATTSPADALELGLLASIKRLVRASDDNVRLAFCLLIAKLRNKHAQVRYLALLIVDELFTRSKLFRTLIVDDFETFMLFSVGYRTDCPLPPPVSRATVLRAKSMEVLEKWNDSYGPHYKPLRLGYEYLKNTLHLQFPNLRQAAAQAEQQRKEREERSRALALEKFENLKHEFPALYSDIEQTLKQLDECFEILNAENKKEEVSAQLSNENHVQEDDIEDYNTNSLRHALAQATCQAAVACETQDNRPVFDTVRDLCRLIASQHFPAVQNWMSILMRVDTRDRESHDFLFKRVIDIRNQLSSAKAKCIELGIDIQEHSEVDEGDDGIIWEEGGVDIGKAFESQTVEVLEVEKEEAALDSEGEGKPSAPPQSTSVDESSKLPRSTLLEEAPVLPWGSYLDRWGSEHVVPVNQRGLLLESHWGRVDFDALLPADKVVEMNMRASYYTSAKTEIPPCLAPLKKGGLCQRRDLRVCPLHGPVVPRDSTGNPLASTTADQTSISQVQSSAHVGSSVSLPVERVGFVKEIAAKAVANVRAQDALELSKKKEKKLQAKRNREHNAAVLREASLANTFQGLGEAIGEDLEKYGELSTGNFKQQNKRAKASLKAMLQPKPTAKDRIAERLLNSRANESTVRELTRGEDAAYKEAFANQW
ncbi:hypothetical protein GOP47_0022517 [Adiantum capillus-veneris]|uniref:UV-stimulated scaffold protein A C-terminal domain-containing protein n=1 Tax=Adiantum capillus-veneris TaxID=13818 RepID=A0A9D4U5Q2_ADICA|nr:hypothetical protein GOP47_0022517 [Adiantum capillus-veneris]